MTTTTHTTSLKRNVDRWFEVFRNHGYYFRYAVVITLIMGMSSRMFTK